MKNLINKVNENKKVVLAVGAGVLGVGTIISTLLKRKKKKSDGFEYDEEISDDYLFDNDLDNNESFFYEDEFDYWNDNDEKFGIKEYESYVQFSKLDNTDYKRNLIIAIDLLYKELFDIKNDISNSFKEVKYDIKMNKDEIISNLEHITELSKIISEMKESE